MKNKYVFKKYNPKYKTQFLYERQILKKILEKQKPFPKIEYVGSSSVVNLGGKGVVDIMIFTNKKQINIIKEKLIFNNYEYVHKQKDRYFFTKHRKYKNKERLVHVHLTYSKESYDETIFFRDYLRNNKKALKEYEDIKKKSSKICNNNSKVYQNYKHSFISEIIKKM